MNNKNLIGREIYITDKKSIFYKKIGTITNISENLEIHYRNGLIVPYERKNNSNIGIIVPKVDEEIIVKSGKIDLSILEECLSAKARLNDWIESANYRRSHFDKEKPKKINEIHYGHIQDYISFSIEGYFWLIPIEEIDRIITPHKPASYKIIKKKEDKTKTIEIPKFPMKYFILEKSL